MIIRKGHRKTSSICIMIIIMLFLVLPCSASTTQVSYSPTNPISLTIASTTATLSQRNALKQAISYLKVLSFSYSGLVEQLEYEGFSTEDAKYAADRCGANWNEQAAKTARNYLRSMSFSQKGLYDQLLYEGFTSSQANYGLAQVGYASSSTTTSSSNTISRENALKTAVSYLRSSSFSYSGLVSQLEYEGFSTEDAKYAVDRCGANWNEQAAKTAASYLRSSSFSRKGLYDQLIYEGFTSSQANYGLAQVGY